MTRAGFPHSDIPGSTLGWQLPEAYRSLPRPSSASDAKASTVRPQQLDTHSTDARTHSAILKEQHAQEPSNKERPPFEPTRVRRPQRTQQYARPPARRPTFPPPHAVAHTGFPHAV